MSFTEAWQTLVENFVLCIDHEKVPQLGGYFSEYVKSGCEVAAADFRLVPLTPDLLRCLITSSNCLTDCMFELQSKYQQFVPDDWGGHMDKGRRDLAVVGFDILEGVVLDILELNPTAAHLDWAQPKLDSLEWERLLIRAVVDFGRSCRARQVRVLPASGCPSKRGAATGVEESPEALKQRYDGAAEASGFEYDQTLDRFVLNLEAN
ncbi:MAG: hypothetical protein GX575_14195 [Candidatus Anammoximicrobium sp.]|nr:hypothetical protein [Candidatus Anammoximicrobium sp.]